MSVALHVTNGDCAADLIREAGMPGEILAWRDVLHDGPVPADLSLAELSRVRASYLSSADAGEFSELAQEFVARDTLLERFPDFGQIVLWFEWDLYDQLQLIQILDTIAHRIAALDGIELPPIEHVSIAGYLGDLPAKRYPELYEERRDVTRLSRGNEPLVVYPSGERVHAPKTESEMRKFVDAPLVLTEAGKDVLAGRRDWISMGGSDRWVGGVHLDGSNARWRWDPALRKVIESEVA